MSNVLEQHRIPSDAIRGDSSLFRDARMSFDILHLFSKPYAERILHHVISASVLRGGVSAGRHCRREHDRKEEAGILQRRTRIFVESDVRRIRRGNVSAASDEL